MSSFFFLNQKFTLAKPEATSPVERLFYLGRDLGLAGLALAKVCLVLVLYLSEDWKMIWLYYIYVLLDLPVKILFPPTPLLWMKHLVRIFLSKTKLWRFLMGLLLWDLTLLLLAGWMILGFVIFPNHLEKLLFLFIPLSLSLLDSLLAFVLLLFSKNVGLAAFSAIAVFVLALVAMNMQENNLMLWSLLACLMAQCILFTFLVKNKMFVI